VIAPPPLIFLAALLLGFILQALLPAPSLAPALQLALGVPLLIAGGVLAATFVRAFRRAGTPIAPSHPARRLVTCGPYRISRNPGYLGMTLTCAGIAFVSDALWLLAPLAVAVLVVDHGVIAREERHLVATFGDEYRRYRATVRRWV